MSKEEKTTTTKNVMYFNGGKYQIISQEEYDKLQAIHGQAMVRCDDGNRIYYIPRMEFSRVLMEVKEEISHKYVRYSTGAKMYDVSERLFADIAKQAGAIHKLNKTVLVSVEMVNDFIETFRIDAG